MFLIGSINYQHGYQLLRIVFLQVEIDRLSHYPYNAWMRLGRRLNNRGCMMKKEVLITISYIAEIEGTQLKIDEHEEQDIVIDKLLSEHFPLIVKIGNGIEAKWVQTTQALLDSKCNNCTKCSARGSWITDRNKPNCLGLDRVEYVNQQIYCSEWAIFARLK